MRNIGLVANATLLAMVIGCSEPPTGRPPVEVNTTVPAGEVRIEMTQAAPNSPRHSEEIPVQDDPVQDDDVPKKAENEKPLDKK